MLPYTGKFTGQMSTAHRPCLQIVVCCCLWTVKLTGQALTMIWLTTSHAGESQTKGCRKCQGPLPFAVTFKSSQISPNCVLTQVCTIEATFLCESDTFSLRHSGEMALWECTYCQNVLISNKHTGWCQGLKDPGPRSKLHNLGYSQKQHLDSSFHSLPVPIKTDCWTCVLDLCSDALLMARSCLTCHGGLQQLKRKNEERV